MKWTYEAREMLYSQLVALFGPHNIWETSGRPGRGLDEQFELFCENFAKTVGATSKNAVKHQISFALPIPDGGVRRWRQGHARSAILNLAAAFRAKFVDASAFPSLIGMPGSASPDDFTPERWRELRQNANEAQEDEDE